MLAMTIDRQFTINEVAAILRVNERTIRRWIKSGRLKATPMPGRGRTATEWRISEGAILALGFGKKTRLVDSNPGDLGSQ